MTDSPSKTPSRGARIAAFVVLGVLGLFMFAIGSSGPTSAIVTLGESAPVDTGDPDTIAPPGTPPAADVAALLDGLSLGNELDGWKIVNFIPMPNNIVWIEFGKDKAFFSVGIGVKGKGNPPAPIQTERYEVGYGMVRPRGTVIGQDVQMKAAGQIASRIRLREKEVAQPAGL